MNTEWEHSRVDRNVRPLGGLARAAGSEGGPGQNESDETDSWKSLQVMLRELPEEPPRRDLEPAVRRGIAAIRRRERIRRWLTLAASGAVAAVVVIVVGGEGLRRQVEPHGGVETPPVEARWKAKHEAVRWLCAVQQPDGGWYRPGDGDQEYREALTGLALLAAIELDGDAALQSAAARAADWLAGRVDREGRIGGAQFPGQPYNQGIGTLALLRWCARHPGDSLREVSFRAARRIVSDQTALGGWGYAGGSEEPNVSVTVWQLQALHAALALDEDEGLARALARGLRWLRSTRNAEGEYGYRRVDDVPPESDALTAMSLYCEITLDAGSMNRSDTRLSLERLKERLASSEREPSYYAAYFALRSLRRVVASDVSTVLERMETRLLVRQEKEGDERGSWPANDAYARVGGRVYATTMATLAVYAP